MRWSSDHLAPLTRAIDTSRSGHPAGVIVIGEAGIGKSSYLDAAVASGAGFVIRRVECLPYQAPPAYGVIAQLGIDGTSSEVGVSAPLVAQRIRAALDEWQADGPVMVVVDDLQWADPESVEALLAVMARAEADRLLLVAATRPLGPTDHSAFQRWGHQATNVQKVRLDGLDREAAHQLLSELRPDISEELADALWRHTEGNPLYLRELAEQYDGLELANRPVLPAPTAYSQAVAARLGRLTPGALSLCQAAAVLGDGWSPLPDVAAVAEADDVSVVDELLDARLLIARHGSPAGTQVRFDHALARSAVYHEIRPGHKASTSPTRRGNREQSGSGLRAQGCRRIGLRRRVGRRLGPTGRRPAR